MHDTDLWYHLFQASCLLSSSAYHCLQSIMKYVHKQTCIHTLQTYYSLVALTFQLCKQKCLVYILTRSFSRYISAGLAEHLTWQGPHAQVYVHTGS